MLQGRGPQGGIDPEQQRVAQETEIGAHEPAVYLFINRKSGGAIPRIRTANADRGI